MLYSRFYCNIFQKVHLVKSSFYLIVHTVYMKKNKYEKYVCGWMAILGRVSTETGSAFCRTSLLDCFWITTTRTRFCSLQKHKCIMFPAPFPVARVPGSSLASRLPSFGWKILIFLQTWLLEIFRELEPASFWRENAILVIILLRVLERERLSIAFRRGLSLPPWIKIPS